MMSAKALFTGKNFETYMGTKTSQTDFHEAEKELIHLLGLENLDNHIEENPSIIDFLEQSIQGAQLDISRGGGDSQESHLFLQRIIYRLNRMKLFWYDDLNNYINESSLYLNSLRLQMEEAWQNWEWSHLKTDEYKAIDIEKALQERTAVDLSPEPTAEELYFRDEMTETGYRRLVAIVSLDGLVEASQLSRVLGGVSNEVHSMLTRILLEEYGGGRLERKHSSFFAVMLNEFGMQTKPEAYFHLVPWEVLANINNSFLVSDHKRFFLRYVGGLLYTEVSIPSAFAHYKKAAKRLGLSKEAFGYWDLHIKEDIRHGQWMLKDVALPLVKLYKEQAWEIVLGYDQQKFLSARAGRAIAKSALQAEKE